MDAEAAFLNALAARPGDDAAWLVYADWLEERGGPGADFIRSAVALGRRLPPGTVVSRACSPWYNRAIMSRRGRSAILERLLEPVSRSLNAEAARQLVRIKADAETQARVDELARKCNEGELTPAERSEYERYVTAGTLLAILQAKARLVLAKNS